MTCAAIFVGGGEFQVESNFLLAAQARCGLCQGLIGRYLQLLDCLPAKHEL